MSVGACVCAVLYGCMSMLRTVGVWVYADSVLLRCVCLCCALWARLVFYGVLCGCVCLCCALWALVCAELCGHASMLYFVGAWVYAGLCGCVGLCCAVLALASMQCSVVARVHAVPCGGTCVWVRVYALLFGCGIHAALRGYNWLCCELQARGACLPCLVGRCPSSLSVGARVYAVLCGCVECLCFSLVWCLYCAVCALVSIHCSVGVHVYAALYGPRVYAVLCGSTCCAVWVCASTLCSVCVRVFAVLCGRVCLHCAPWARRATVACFMGVCVYAVLCWWVCLYYALWTHLCAVLSGCVSMLCCVSA